MYEKRSDHSAVGSNFLFDNESYRSFSHEANKENSPRNSKKSPEELSADALAAENAAQRAKGELRVLDQERAKLEKQRKTQLKDFETAKNDARRLLEVSGRSFFPVRSVNSVDFLLFRK